jgi:hypothetical protein
MQMMTMITGQELTEAPQMAPSILTLHMARMHKLRWLCQNHMACVNCHRMDRILASILILGLWKPLLLQALLVLALLEHEVCEMEVMLPA